jgi:hypothetical protein
MLEKLRSTLVDSYVGPICMGYLLAQAILSFVSIFSSPAVALLMRHEMSAFNLVARTRSSIDWPVGDYAVPPVIQCLVLFLIWYVLFRWLYFRPFTKSVSASASEPSAPAN